MTSLEAEKVMGKFDSLVDQMKQDVELARNGLPYVFCDMKKNNGIEKISEFIISHGGL